MIRMMMMNSRCETNRYEVAKNLDFGLKNIAISGWTIRSCNSFITSHFHYLLSTIYVNTRRAKAWTAINRVSVIWKSDLTDKIKRSFFQAVIVSILLYGCTTWTLTKHMEKKLHKNAASNIEKVLEAVPNKAAAVRPPTTHHENYSS